ncbi:MAG TPA: D-alanine--D-alanine ligase family protein [Candidatus Dormibacteraeota bacterium]|jgi:D-alanine-D-alanine ligase
MSRTRIGVLFGGRSTEHEVSILSARSIISALDPERFEVIPLYVDRTGRWLVGTSLAELTNAQDSGAYVYLPPDPTQRSLVRAAEADSTGPGLPRLDVVFPVFHGLNGEDGTIQGVLELANVPYVGSGVLGSALGLDKIYMKRAFQAVGLPVVDYLSVTRRQFEEDADSFVKEVETRLGYPCFVKFANSGSSVGTSKAHNRGELLTGLRLAAGFDRKLLVERGVEARELEISVLGNDTPEASVVGEVVPIREFYDYEAKYLDEGSRLIIPAEIPANLSDQMRAMAVQAFQAVDAAGMARVDFFLERGTDRVYLNEVNTIPGFTQISMYPKLWEASGLPYQRLLERLVELAIERFEDKQRSQTAIDTRLLREAEA